MSTSLRVLLVLLCALALGACPPNRGGGDDDDSASEDDDDAAADVEPGLFSYYFAEYYEPGYYLGWLRIPLGNELACDELDYGYPEDLSGDSILLHVIRGVDREWDGDYTWLYEPDCALGDYDYGNAHCFHVWGIVGGVEVEGGSDDTFRIDTFSAASVAGSLTFAGTDYDFAVTNCGEFDNYGDRSAPPAAPAQPPASAGTPTVRKPVERSWRLRFR